MSTERRFANIGHDHDGTYLPLTAGSNYQLTGDLWITSEQPNIWLTETDQAADTKVWRFVASGGIFYAQVLNDAISAATTWLTVSRSTYTAATSITFNATSSMGYVAPYSDFRSTAGSLYLRCYYDTTSLAGYIAASASGLGFLSSADAGWAFRVNLATKDTYAFGHFTVSGTGYIYPTAGGMRWAYGSLGVTYSNAATVLGNNVYVNPSDAVSGQVRHSTTHASYGHTIYELYGGAHYWYGASAASTADAVVSKTLRLTLGTTGILTATSNVVIPGGYGFYVDGPTNAIYVSKTNGSYGSISVGSSSNTYAGVRFDAASGTPNFMFATGSNLWGVYREGTSSWDILYNAGVMSINAQTQFVATAAAASWGTRCIMSRGTAAPSGGADGDIYFRTTTIGLYINLAGVWTLVAS